MHPIADRRESIARAFPGRRQIRAHPDRTQRPSSRRRRSQWNPFAPHRRDCRGCGDPQAHAASRIIAAGDDGSAMRDQAAEHDRPSERNAGNQHVGTQRFDPIVTEVAGRRRRRAASSVTSPSTRTAASFDNKHRRQQPVEAVDETDLQQSSRQRRDRLRTGSSRRRVHVAFRARRRGRAALHPRRRRRGRRRHFRAVQNSARRPPGASTIVVAYPSTGAKTARLRRNRTPPRTRRCADMACGAPPAAAPSIGDRRCAPCRHRRAPHRAPPAIRARKRGLRHSSTNGASPDAGVTQPSSDAAIFKRK